CEFFIDGVPLKTIGEGETQDFLGNPVGFRAIKHQAEMEEIVGKARRILTSKLAPWQRLDAIKTFIFPSLNFIMRNGHIKKEDWAKIDRILRA
ncbi:hypothetical protein, partial [Klebsiella pneumoniae]|uniref:hypothetical protein n=1 Tax=Klebsiella pneumoniae TaxID=573 RepID=UPI0040553CE6